MAEIDISKALNRVPYGFYALTSRDGDDRNVMVLNWFTQASYDPRHVVVSIENDAYSYGLVSKSKKFVINIFNKDEVEVIKKFSKPRFKNAEKFEAANYTDGPVTGVPVLDEAAAYLECEVVTEFDTGSGHIIIIAKVVGGSERNQGSAADTLTLLDIGWSYSG